jgi:hypothetical protein
VFVGREAFGDCSVEALRVGFPGGGDAVGNVTLRDDALGVGALGVGALGVGALGVGVGALIGWMVFALEASICSAEVPVAGGAEPALDAAGTGSLGDTGFTGVLDAIELVCAPPVLCTMPVRGSGVDDGSADDGLPVAVDDVVETVVSDGDFEPDGDVDAGDELAEEVDRLVLSVGEEPEDEELVSVGAPSATPGVVATAAPTPSATANAPTRPTWLA